MFEEWDGVSRLVADLKIDVLARTTCHIRILPEVDKRPCGAWILACPDRSRRGLGEFAFAHG